LNTLKTLLNTDKTGL